MKIISRKEALSLGLKYYFTGKPCKYGHLSKRKTCDFGCYQCKLEENKKWMKENVEKAREKNKRHYYKNRSEMIRKRLQYQKENPLVSAATQHRRRSKLKTNTDVHFDKNDVKNILELQKNKCAICNISVGKKVKFHIDHIIPVAKNGNNSKENIQILCADCNLRKSDKDPIEYAQSLGKLL